MARVHCRRVLTILIIATSFVIFPMVMLQLRLIFFHVPISVNDKYFGRPRQNEINSTTLGLCPETPNSLLGRLTVNLTELSDNSVPVNNITHFGGWWKPIDCRARANVAILIPYRNRPEQLKIFLRHMTPVFQRQLLSFRIFVVEQLGNTVFNKGAIYNIGFDATFSFGDFDCFIFHDIDLLAETDLNYYGCSTSPQHMSVAIDKFLYKLPYPNIFGGIQAFTKKDYILTNGYSNKYWGWGGEDDDLFKRIQSAGLFLTRPSFEIGRYKMNQEHHFRSHHGNLRNKVLARHGGRDRNSDGLSTISYLKFTVRTHEERECTFISIDLTKT